jgi:hypothetical protein
MGLSPEDAHKRIEEYRQARDQKRLDANLARALNANPERAAQTQKIARDLDVEFSLVDRNIEELSAAQQHKALQERLEKTPKLKKRFTEDYEFAEVAFDDGGLFDLEESFTRTAKAAGDKIAKSGVAAGVGAAQATLGISESIWRTPEDIGRTLDGINKVLGIKAMSDWAVEKGWLPGIDVKEGGLWQEALGNWTNSTEIANRIAEANDDLLLFEPFNRMAKKGEQASAALESLLSGDVDPVLDILSDPEAWAGFIGQAAPSLYAAYKSGGSIPFIAWLEGMEASNDAADFEQRTGQQIDPANFLQAKAQILLFNTLLEKAGLETVFGQGKGFLSSAIKGFLGESTTEAGQQFNSNMAALVAYDPERKLSEGVLASWMGGGGAGAGGGALSALGRASGPNGEFARDLQRADTAIVNAAVLQSHVDIVNETKLKDRSKDHLRTFIQDLVGAEDSVYLAPEDAQAFFQSHPEVLEALPEDARERITEALTIESEVEIGTADYLTHFTDFHAEIRDMVRNDIDGMSAKEAALWAEKGMGQMEADGGRCRAGIGRHGRAV